LNGTSANEIVSPDLPVFDVGAVIPLAAGGVKVTVSVIPVASADSPLPSNLIEMVASTSAICTGRAGLVLVKVCVPVGQFTAVVVAVPV
jgi:hypothetical protein